MLLDFRCLLVYAFSLPTMVPRVSPTFGYNVNVQTSRPVNEFFKFEFFNMHLSLQLALMLK